MRLCLRRGSSLSSLSKAFMLSGVLLSGLTGIHSQTVLIDPTGDGGFETGTTFAANGWTEVGPAADTQKRWYCGTGQPGFTGARAAFIGNDAVTVGSLNAARTVHLYKTITIPSGATNIQLDFDYKQEVSDADLFYGVYYDFVLVSLDAGTPVNGNMVLSAPVFGPYPDDDYPGFNTQSIIIPDMYATGTPINLIFTFISDAANPVGYGAIDNVSLTYDPLPHVDIMPLTLGSPLLGDCYGNNEEVSVLIKNTGGDPIDFSFDPLTINTSVTGINPMTFAPVTLTTGTLAVGATQNVTIVTNYDMSKAGVYNFTAVTGTSNDGNNANDTMHLTLEQGLGVQATVSDSIICAGTSVDLSAAGSPYYSVLINEGFNADAPGWTQTNLSEYGIVGASTWTVRENGYYPGGYWDDPFYSNDDSRFYLTNSDLQGYDTYTQTILSAPSVFTIGYDSLVLEFYHFFQQSSGDDSACVEVSLDGINWDTARVFVDDYGVADGFGLSTVDLSSFAGNPTVYVRFRFVGYWGYGWAIDNVNIKALGNSYTYNWTSTPAGFTSTSQNPTGVVVNTNTQYQVTATAGMGCNTRDTVTVNVNPAPVLTTVVTDVTCNGDVDGEIDLTATGGSPAFSYSWSNSATTQDLTGLAPGTYTVTVTDANTCTHTATATVDEPAVITITSVVTDESTGNDGAINLTVTGGTPAYTYAWSNSAATEDISGLAEGTYTVTVTDANGCSESATISVGSTVGIDNQGNVSLGFYPNPSTGIINISVKGMETNTDMLIQVMDMSGKIIMAKKTLPTSADYIEQIDLTNAASGTYMVRISTDSGTYNGRIIINK